MLIQGQGLAFHILVVLLSLGLPWSTGEETIGDDAEKQNAGKQQPAKPRPWGYHAKHGELGPDKWSKLFPDMCGPSQLRQSPIDIQTQKAVFMEDLNDIDIVFKTPQVVDDAAEQIISYDVKNMTMKNNGHSVTIRSKEDVYFVGGELGDAYKVFNIHFHWGSNNTNGSEHRVDGRQFPLEMHIVAYDSERYGSIAEAIDKYNSLAVLGTFFEIGEENVNLNPILDRFDQIIQQSSSTEMPWVNPSDLIPPETYRYFRYEGSLTTPRCFESVIWTVFNITNTISQAQLEKFYQLQEVSNTNASVSLHDNWRSPQPLNGRPVYSSFSTLPPGLIQSYEEEHPDVDALTGKDTATNSVAMTATTILVATLAAALLK